MVGGIEQCSVMYRMDVALWGECSIPTAEGLDLSAVGMVQLAAHKVSKCILCR